MRNMKPAKPAPQKDGDDKNKKQTPDQLKKQIGLGISYLLINLIGLWVFQQFILGPLLIHEVEIPYSEFKAKIAAKQIVDVLPGQEAGNAEYVIQAGAGVNAQDPIDALQTMYHWLADDGKLLAQCSQKARLLGRPRAAYDVAELAWGATERGAQPAPDALAGNLRALLRA